MIDNRRSFVAKLFAGSSLAAASVAAAKAGTEPLIVVPRPEPVEIFQPRDIPRNLPFVSGGQMISATHINDICRAVNNLNLAVFGPRTDS